MVLSWMPKTSSFNAALRRARYASLCAGMVEKDDDGEEMVYVASWEVLKFQNKQEI